MVRPLDRVVIFFFATSSPMCLIRCSGWVVSVLQIQATHFFLFLQMPQVATLSDCWHHDRGQLHPPLHLLAGSHRHGPLRFLPFRLVPAMEPEEEGGEREEDRASQKGHREEASPEWSERGREEREGGDSLEKEAGTHWEWEETKDGDASWHERKDGRHRACRCWRSWPLTDKRLEINECILYNFLCHYDYLTVSFVFFSPYSPSDREWLVVAFIYITLCQCQCQCHLMPFLCFCCAYVIVMGCCCLFLFLSFLA